MLHRNRFRGLDLIDRAPDELWTEVCDIVQETGIKTIPKKKKCKQVPGSSPGGSREFEAGMASARIRKQLLN